MPTTFSFTLSDDDVDSLTDFLAAPQNFQFGTSTPTFATVTALLGTRIGSVVGAARQYSPAAGSAIETAITAEAAAAATKASLLNPVITVTT